MNNNNTGLTALAVAIHVAFSGFLFYIGVKYYNQAYKYQNEKINIQRGSITEQNRQIEKQNEQIEDQRLLILEQNEKIFKLILEIESLKK
jgi:cell division protein YceG involved in septum cleavage